jgi:hypothetical protein
VPELVARGCVRRRGDMQVVLTLCLEAITF